MTLLAQADAALARGDRAAALQLLRSAAEAHDDYATWARIAALHRAMGQPRRALEAIQRALVHAPLDFVALALRASLLEAIEPGAAGSAWAEALAQRPDGPVPAGMEGAVAAGEKLRDAWLASREAAIRAAMEEAEDRADQDEAWKLDRFRSNALRQTRIWHSQPTHYHFPGLTEREFHPRHRFPWLEEVEAATPVIRAEMEAAVASNRAELAPYIQYQDYEALAQWRELNRNTDWTALHLIRMGEVVEANAALCPRTMELLARMPQPAIKGASANAMFSLLAPETTIPSHVGVNNTRLLCHLPLVVPEGCWFRVGGETRPWREGEAFVFDDTVEHEASNPSKQLRVVMIFDVWHPDLTPVERAGVAALIEAEGGVRA